MDSYRHIAPALRVFQGADSLASLGTELQRVKSTRAVLFCGGTLGRDPRAFNNVVAAMGDRCVGVYTGVRPQSPLSAVEEAAAVLRRLKADAVVAVGGGSAIVTARAASILLAEEGPCRALCTRPDGSGKLVSPKLLAAKLPQLVIPTTPTTAIVKAGSAVLDPVDGGRLALYDPKTRAQSVFIHPELLASSPRKLFVSAALNSLAVAVEGLLSCKGNPMSDAMLMHALRLLVQRLPDAARSDDLDVRAELVAAAMLCGTGSDSTGAGAALPLAHAISAKYGVDNGIADAIVLPPVLRFNADAAMAGFGKAAAAQGLRAQGSPADAVTEALEALFAQLAMPRRLRDVGVPRDGLAEIARVSMDDWYLQNNPRPVRDAGELQEILQKVW